MKDLDTSTFQDPAPEETEDPTVIEWDNARRLARRELRVIAYQKARDSGQSVLQSVWDNAVRLQKEMEVKLGALGRSMLPKARELEKIFAERELLLATSSFGQFVSAVDEWSVEEPSNEDPTKGAHFFTSEQDAEFWVAFREAVKAGDEFAAAQALENLLSGVKIDLQYLNLPDLPKDPDEPPVIKTPRGRE